MSFNDGYIRLRKVKAPGQVLVPHYAVGRRGNLRIFNTSYDCRLVGREHSSYTKATKVYNNIVVLDEPLAHAPELIGKSVDEGWKSGIYVVDKAKIGFERKACSHQPANTVFFTIAGAVWKGMDGKYYLQENVGSARVFSGVIGNGSSFTVPILKKTASQGGGYKLLCSLEELAQHRISKETSQNFCNGNLGIGFSVLEVEGEEVEEEKRPESMRIMDMKDKGDILYIEPEIIWFYKEKYLLNHWCFGFRKAWKGSTIRVQKIGADYYLLDNVLDLKITRKDPGSDLPMVLLNEHRNPGLTIQGMHVGDVGWVQPCYVWKPRDTNQLYLNQYAPVSKQPHGAATQQLGFDERGHYLINAQDETKFWNIATTQGTDAPKVRRSKEEGEEKVVPHVYSVKDMVDGSKGFVCLIDSEVSVDGKISVKRDAILFRTQSSHDASKVLFLQKEGGKLILLLHKCLNIKKLEPCKLSNKSYVKPDVMVPVDEIRDTNKEGSVDMSAFKVSCKDISMFRLTLEQKVNLLLQATENIENISVTPKVYNSNSITVTFKVPGGSFTLIDIRLYNDYSNRICYHFHYEVGGLKRGYGDRVEFRNKLGVSSKPTQEETEAFEALEAIWLSMEKYFKL